MLVRRFGKFGSDIPGFGQKAPNPGRARSIALNDRSYSAHLNSIYGKTKINFAAEKVMAFSAVEAVATNAWHVIESRMRSILAARMHKQDTVQSVLEKTDDIREGRGKNLWRVRG